MSHRLIENVKSTSIFVFPPQNTTPEVDVGIVISTINNKVEPDLFPRLIEVLGYFGQRCFHCKISINTVGDLDAQHHPGFHNRFKNSNKGVRKLGVDLRKFHAFWPPIVDGIGNLFSECVSSVHQSGHMRTRRGKVVFVLPRRFPLPAFECLKEALQHFQTSSSERNGMLVSRFDDGDFAGCFGFFGHGSIPFRIPMPQRI